MAYLIYSPEQEGRIDLVPIEQRVLVAYRPPLISPEHSISPLSLLVRDEMKKRGLNQAQLAQFTGISTATMSNIFLGRNKTASIDTLHKLSRYFGISLGEIADLAISSNRRPSFTYLRQTLENLVTGLEGGNGQEEVVKRLEEVTAFVYSFLIQNPDLPKIIVAGYLLSKGNALFSNYARIVFDPVAAEEKEVIRELMGQKYRSVGFHLDLLDSARTTHM
ncbi:helix-turn-helix transcriptional regulator [Candidatus Woesearchaeota archaeon]|nr:helix-turn-helix transcriptional regulator [Candidatus Woesearchaeota archaeon]